MNKTLLVAGIAIFIGLAIWYWYFRPKYIMGETAPDFEAKVLSGETVKLSDLRGKYVLLQFWGSWCGPCRAENPHLVALYNKYHDKGFEIFSVGIERREDQWKRAIESDGMIWKYHTSDFKEFDGEIAGKYRIHSIPSTWLIQPDGIIRGVNLTPEAIEQVLNH